MEGKLRAAVQHGFRLTAEQWREVEHELNVCLQEHRITAEQYLAALTEIKVLMKPLTATLEPMDDLDRPDPAPGKGLTRAGAGSRGRVVRHRASHR